MSSGRESNSYHNYNSCINDNNNSTIYPICTHLANSINKFLDNEALTPLLRRVQAQTRVTLDVIKTALERYSLEEISLSYNGGKDCLVLLILLLSALAGTGAIEPVETTTTSSSRARSSSKIRSSSSSHRLPSVYVMSQNPFPEVDAFVTTSAETYGLDLVRYTFPMKTAFTCYLEEHRKIKAILVGTRRSDPHGKLLTHFDETDSGWPHFMRVHPVIDWHYSEIWAFIRHFEIPYCKLYDQGFTSLGGINDTHPNPALRVDEHSEVFKPAYELEDEDAERLGRDDS
ncbi:putative FAD synthase [Golovinomyces cichoracearum]|uniref:FAD synthase n=1 Tax=Golovinomyces cichoracearum TaxID=62708 RepID=A0A420HGW7_9PEZI|nr:putative FAD synthase [Golovinomyces cichoracearum]